VHLPPIAAERDPTLRETLEYQVSALLDAHRRRHPEAATLLRGHAARQGTDEEVFGAPLDLETARKVIAREHEFRDWDAAMDHGDQPVDRVFEAAIDAVVAGDLAALEAFPRDHPDLATRRSAFGHRCTLLHYVAANGVEQTRQRSPANAPAIARALLDAGADPNAGSRSYGPEDMPLELLVSSCHPGEAGVQADLVEILCRAGAKVEGLRGDGSPLWTAITWGYRHSAERLVKCGARVDNIITDAALGYLDRVKSYFGPDGCVFPGPEIRGVSCFTHGRPFDPARLLEYAFITAAGCGRREVVEFLLTKGPDLTFREPIYNNTALDAASYPHSAAGFPHGHPDVIRLLRATGAC
jgi:ankyrin repeat protein